MSYAPSRLLDARAYLQSKTGLPAVSLGIVGDSAHRTGYHLGKDRLGSNDYSVRTARDKAGLTNAASALDIGRFARLVALTVWAVGEARAGRRPDTREIIGPWTDGRAYRFDHLGGWRAELRAHGDSHETHMHESFYRDSEARDKVRFYRPFFENAPAPAPGPLPVPDPDWTEALIMSLPTLRRGARGSAVKRLQGLLLSHNPDFGNVGWIDGAFGPATEDGVKRFQRAYSLQVDGIAGRQTWTTLLTR